MPLTKDPKRTIEIPQEVQLEVNKHVYTFKGPKGKLQRKLYSPNIKITIKDNKLILEPNVKKPTKREKVMINTTEAHLRNLIKGAIEGFTYKLKICSGHFPMTVTSNNKEVITKNFLGEKVPRVAKITEGSEVKIDGEEITVESLDIEKAGQTAANIEKSTVVKGRDKRKYQDGIYITEKAGKKI